MGGPGSWRRAGNWVDNQEYLHQQLPYIHGTWYFVNPQDGSDNRSGRSPDLAFDGVEAAYTAVDTDKGDGICLLSQGDSTADTTSYLTAAITWAKNNITMCGVAAPTRYAGRARISQLTASLVTLLTMTGYNNRIMNVHLANYGTTGTGCLSVTGERNYFQNVHAIGGGGVTTASIADMDLSLAGRENTFVECTFGTDTFDKEDLAGFSMTFPSGALAARNRFYDCEFNQSRAAGTTAGAILLGDSAALARLNVFDNCLFTVYRDAGISAESAVVIGTKSTNGYILFKDCVRMGFTDWAGTAHLIYTNSPVGHEAGGATVAVNPS